MRDNERERMLHTNNERERVRNRDREREAVNDRLVMGQVIQIRNFVYLILILKEGNKYFCFEN